MLKLIFRFYQLFIENISFWIINNTLTICCYYTIYILINI